MKAIIIGGSGAVGSALVQKLLASSKITEVVLLLRKKSFEDHPKLRQVITDFERIENFSEHIRGDVAVNCMGTTLKDAGTKSLQWRVDYDYPFKFAQIANQNRIKTFLSVSAQNANADSKLFYPRMKGELEKSMEQLGFQTLILVQPSMLIRPDSKRMPERFGVKLLMFFNSIGFLRKLRPVPVESVAQAIVQSIDLPPQGISRISNTDICAFTKTHLKT